MTKNMMEEHINRKLKEVFETTVEGSIEYDGGLNHIDYYKLFCKAASQEKLYKLMGTDLCMFNYKHEDKDSVLIVFFIPITSEDYGAKNVAERVMQIVKETEECFVTLDYVRSEEIKEDKFIYVIAIKYI